MVEARNRHPVRTNGIGNAEHLTILVGKDINKNCTYIIFTKKKLWDMDQISNLADRKSGITGIIVS